MPIISVYIANPVISGQQRQNISLAGARNRHICECEERRTALGMPCAVITILVSVPRIMTATIALLFWALFQPRYRGGARNHCDLILTVISEN